MYRLKALITLEQVNTSVVEKKKKKNLIISKTSIVSVVNFHNCMQMSLLAMFEMTHHHSVLSRIEALEFLCNYTGV